MKRNAAVRRPSQAEIISVNQLERKFGSVAQRIMAPGNVEKPMSEVLRTNALLRKDEWIEFDTRVVDIARQQLIVFEDLRAAGLVRPLRSVGVLISQYETMSDMTPADVTMSGISRSNRDSTEFQLVGVPVPFIHKEFEVNIRRLEASRMMGDTISTTQGTQASRKVADRIEAMIFNGVAGTLEGSKLYGLKTQPNINTGTATGGFDSIANIFTTLNNMVMAAEADNHMGPFILYCHSNQLGEMRAVFTDGSGQSAMTRVRANIPQIRDIKAVQSLSDGDLVLVELNEDVIDFVVAEEITMVEWDTYGGFISNFNVVFCGAPRVKADAEGHSGVVFYTGA
jgi:hypothetical protein